jgi:hypothetical protein
MNNLPIENQPLACDLTAIPTAERETHILTATQIFQSAKTITELPTGYALQLPNEGSMFMSVAQFAENERRCCPFWNFGIDIEANNGPIWLRLTGPEGAKELLQSALSEHLSAEQLKQLIQTGGDASLDETVAKAMPVLAEAVRAGNL